MKILSLNIRGFGGTYKKLSLKRIIKRMDTHIIIFQKTMVSGSKVREALNTILKDWCICTLVSKGIFKGLCSSWNPYKALFNAYQSSTGIVLDWKVQGWNHEVKIVNYYGLYSQRKEVSLGNFEV